MMKITIDIETIPDQRAGAREQYIKDAAENIKIPSGSTKESLAADLNITDKDQIKALSRTQLEEGWIREVGPAHAESAGDAEWRKTSFSGLSGQLLMIGMAINDDAPFVISGDEPTVLMEFRRALAEAHKTDHMGLPTIIGHNLTDFDLPFIFHRSVMLEIAPYPTFPAFVSRYSDRIFDTMTKWAGFGGRIKLDVLAQALGAGGKGDIDGSMVYDYYVAGRLDEIITYCANDVQMTRAVYRRMTFHDHPFRAQRLDVVEAAIA